MHVPFEPPRSLSPSKVSSFRNCPLAFRFSVIEHLPDPPTVATVKGTFVHRVLELLFWNHPAGQRTLEAAHAERQVAWAELQEDPDFLFLELAESERAHFERAGEMLVENYFRLEDPNLVNAVGMEVMMEARIGDVRLRGIIDRLDRRDDGELVVIDYKTGKAPAPKYEQARLAGVHLYALLCEEMLGQRPVEVRLLHLLEPTVISATPSDQTIRSYRQKTTAIWDAIERACATGDFQPRTSGLCNYCRYQAFCPAFGGDPTQAAVVLGEPA